MHLYYTKTCNPSPPQAKGKKPVLSCPVSNSKYKHHSLQVSAMPKTESCHHGRGKVCLFLMSSVFAYSPGGAPGYQTLKQHFFV